MIQQTAHTHTRTETVKFDFIQTAAERKSNRKLLHPCCPWAQRLGRCCIQACDSSPESHGAQAPTEPLWCGGKTRVGMSWWLWRGKLAPQMVCWLRSVTPTTSVKVSSSFLKPTRTYNCQPTDLHSSEWHWRFYLIPDATPHLSQTTFKLLCWAATHKSSGEEQVLWW